jgi:Ribosomal protein L24e
MTVDDICEHILFQIFRFGASKNESLFLQRKNPRKIAWTQLYRRMHKKGITEEVAKKRSRRTVKHQRGIVGADLEAIKAKRTQSAQDRTQQRLAAITKGKAEKKEKEAKKPKVCIPTCPRYRSYSATGATPHGPCGQPEEYLQTAGKRWTGRSLSPVYYLDCVLWHMYHDYACDGFLCEECCHALNYNQCSQSSHLHVNNESSHSEAWEGLPGCVGLPAEARLSSHGLRDGGALRNVSTPYSPSFKQAIPV